MKKKTNISQTTGDNSNIAVEVDKALRTLSFHFVAALVFALVVVCILMYTITSSERWACSQAQEFSAKALQTCEGILIARELEPLVSSMDTPYGDIRHYYVAPSLMSEGFYDFDIDMENDVLYTREELSSLLTKTKSGKYRYTIDQLEQKLKQDLADGTRSCYDTALKNRLSQKAVVLAVCIMALIGAFSVFSVAVYSHSVLLRVKADYEQHGMTVKTDHM